VQWLYCHAMEIHAAQQDVRRVFLGGFAGQLVSATVWLASAAFATWGSRRAAAAVLFFGGMLIFPLTQATLRLMRRPASLPSGHPMNALAMQVAFVLPLCLPLVYAASVHHAVWFYPAFMVVVGAHYLPFIFLYGMPHFGVLSAILVTAGILIGLYLPQPFSLGAWLTAAVLALFAVLGLRASRQ
jgi:hypothetical protein